MRRVIHFARRNMFLVAATALLMAGAGCAGAIKKSGDQLTEDALKPITVPIQVYGQAVDTASNAAAYDRLRLESLGE
ncbi:MAG TPA: hypothetical protein VJ694_04175 [Patescibacteria group bacterium]|nr:hypothetical protein [Patescibacteria group bacterium]